MSISFISPYLFVVITTAGVSLLATTLLVVLFATPLTAVLTIFLATAVTPNGVSQYVQNLDGRNRVVALDD
jgi:hypothetical protein